MIETAAGNLKPSARPSAGASIPFRAQSLDRHCIPAACSLAAAGLLASCSTIISTPHGPAVLARDTSNERLTVTTNADGSTTLTYSADQALASTATTATGQATQSLASTWLRGLAWLAFWERNNISSASDAVQTAIAGEGSR